MYSYPPSELNNYTEQGHNLRNIEEIKSLLNLKFQTFKKTQVMT
jgi:hypothetical protein